jgi:hypothetical protein
MLVLPLTRSAPWFCVHWLEIAHSTTYTVSPCRHHSPRQRANDFLPARPPSSPFGRREDGLDVSDRQLLPDSSTTSTRAPFISVRVSSHGAFDVFTTSTGASAGRPESARGVLFPFWHLHFEMPHLTTTEPLTPLSLPSIRVVALARLFHDPSKVAKTASAACA